MRFTTTILLCFISYFLFGQKNEYKVVLNGADVGFLYVSKKQQNDKIFYSYKMNIEVNFITKFQLNYDVQCTYNDQQLLYALVKNDWDGNNHQNSETKWDQTKYTINTPEKKNKIYDKPIPYSAIRLFFDEPKNVVQVYSEKYGAFTVINDLKNGSYSQKTVNGMNKYYYKKGVMSKAEISTPVTKMVLNLME